MVLVFPQVVQYLLHVMTSPPSVQLSKALQDFLLQSIKYVGPNHVVQVITDNATNCKAAEKI